MRAGASAFCAADKRSQRSFLLESRFDVHAGRRHDLRWIVASLLSTTIILAADRFKLPGLTAPLERASAASRSSRIVLGRRVRSRTEFVVLRIDKDRDRSLDSQYCWLAEFSERPLPPLPCQLSVELVSRRALAGPKVRKRVRLWLLGLSGHGLLPNRARRPMRALPSPDLPGK